MLIIIVCYAFKVCLLCHSKMQMLSLITLPSRSKPVKALIVLVTQFNIFWMKTGMLVTVPLTEVNYTVKAQKSIKTSST